MAEQSGRARARRRIQHLTGELERLGQNPILDPEASKDTHAAIWKEIRELDEFLKETSPKRKAPATTGGRKNAQLSHTA